MRIMRSRWLPTQAGAGPDVRAGLRPTLRFRGPCGRLKAPEAAVSFTASALVAGADCAMPA